MFIGHRYVIQVLWVGLKKKKRVRTDTKCRFTDRHRKEIGSTILNLAKLNLVLSVGHYTSTFIGLFFGVGIG